MGVSGLKRIEVLLELLQIEEKDRGKKK